MGWLAFLWEWLITRQVVPSATATPSPRVTASLAASPRITTTVVASPRITSTVTMEPVQED